MCISGLDKYSQGLCVISLWFHREMALSREKWCSWEEVWSLQAWSWRTHWEPNPISFSFTSQFPLGEQLHPTTCPYSPTPHSYPTTICCLINQKQWDHRAIDWSHETGSPNKPFLFLRWFILVVCYSNGRLIIIMCIVKSSMSLLNSTYSMEVAFLPQVSQQQQKISLYIIKWSLTRKIPLKKTLPWVKGPEGLTAGFHHSHKLAVFSYSAAWQMRMDVLISSVLFHSHTLKAGVCLFLVYMSPDLGNPHLSVIYTEILNMEFNFLLGWDVESTQKKDWITFYVWNKEVIEHLVIRRMSCGRGDAVHSIISLCVLLFWACSKYSL